MPKVNVVKLQMSLPKDLNAVSYTQSDGNQTSTRSRDIYLLHVN